MEQEDSCGDDEDDPHEPVDVEGPGQVLTLVVEALLLELILLAMMLFLRLSGRRRTP